MFYFGLLSIYFLFISLFRVGYHHVILGEHNRGSNGEPIQDKLVSKVTFVKDFREE